MDEIVVAVVRRPHGLGGEMHVAERTGDPERVFVPGRTLSVVEGRPGGLPGRLTLESVRPHKGGWLVQFREVTDRQAAEAYAGLHLALSREELRPLDPDEYFVQELVGFEVVVEGGDVVGEVEAVYDAGGQTLLGVGAGGRERLVPFGRQVVRKVDTETRKIWIDPPAGLLEL